MMMTRWSVQRGSDAKEKRVGAVLVNTEANAQGGPLQRPTPAPKCDKSVPLTDPRASKAPRNDEARERNDHADEEP
jgi:hypothetical protein